MQNDLEKLNFKQSLRNQRPGGYENIEQKELTRINTVVLGRPIDLSTERH